MQIYETVSKEEYLG